MSPKRPIALATALLVLCANPQELIAAELPESPSAQLDRLLIVDEEPEAFFAAATYQIATRMKGALRAFCASTPTPPTLCTSKFVRFLQPISEYGRRKQYGFACEGESLYKRNKYFRPDDIRANSTCMYFGCLAKHGPCEPIVPSKKK